MKRLLLLPALLVCTSAFATMNTALQQAAHAAPTASMGIQVASERTGKILYQYHAGHTFTPASNAKLFTASAAFFTLGLNYRFNTTLHANVHQLAAGTLNGNVYLDFVGDPTLTTNNVNALMGQLRAKGITHINGNFIIDATHFSGPHQPIGSAWDDSSFCYGAPTGSIIIDQNCMNVKLTHVMGHPAHMAPGVNARYFHMTNHLNLVPMHDSNQCVFYRQDNDDNVTLSGCLPDRRVWNLGLAIKNPAPFAQGLIHTDLRTHGITLTGQVKMGTLPRGVPVIATHQSVDLWQIINPMLIHSNDIFANAIGKTVGYHTTGVGSFKSAARSIMAVLAKHGVNPREYNLEDAAGLSRYNKVSPKVISQLLFVMAHSKFAHTFEHSLPTTGETGTLTYFDPKLKGVVHAKTGSMTGVFALSGYMTTARHHKVIFSVMLNGILGSERHGHIAVEKVLGGIYRGF